MFCIKEDVSASIKFVMPSVKNDFLAKHLIHSGYCVCTFQKFDYTIFNGFYMIFSKCIGHDIERIYNKQYLTGQSDIYIVFDAMTNTNLLIRLRNDNPNARLIFLIWNPLSKVKANLDVLSSLGYEIWSYGKKQCQENGFKQNTYFYCESMYSDALYWQNEHDQEYEYDICFVGKDKGRMEIIDKWLKKYKESELKTNLYFTADHFWERYKNKRYRKSIPYEKMQLLHIKSRSVLEIVPSDEVDMTMRVLDSIILQKKLITNSRKIKECDYYNPNNVFVIGEDNDESIREFLSSPYIELSYDVKRRYNVDEWVKRFVEDKPINGEKYA